MCAGLDTHQIAPRPFPGGMKHREPLFNWAQPLLKGPQPQNFHAPVWELSIIL